jgi:hypothetical protein
MDLSRVYDFRFCIFVHPNFWIDTFGLNYMSKDAMFEWWRDSFRQVNRNETWKRWINHRRNFYACGYSLLHFLSLKTTKMCCSKACKNNHAETSEICETKKTHRNKMLSILKSAKQKTCRRDKWPLGHNNNICVTLKKETQIPTSLIVTYFNSPQ